MSIQELQVGSKAEVVWDVERRWCTQRGDYHIFSTPSMVQLAERAAMQVLMPVLGAQQVSVGTRVDIRHLAPTLEGMKVRAVATVSGIDDARLTFAIEIFDDLVKVGEATHERFVLDLGRYVRRLEKKRAEVEAHKAQ
jgi:predicted thioesterase